MSAIAINNDRLPSGCQCDSVQSPPGTTSCSECPPGIPETCETVLKGEGGVFVKVLASRDGNHQRHASRLCRPLPVLPRSEFYAKRR